MSYFNYSLNQTVKVNGLHTVFNGISNYFNSIWNTPPATPLPINTYVSDAFTATIHGIYWWWIVEISLFILLFMIRRTNTLANKYKHKMAQNFVFAVFCLIVVAYIIYII